MRRLLAVGVASYLCLATVLLLRPTGVSPSLAPHANLQVGATAMDQMREGEWIQLLLNLLLLAPAGLVIGAAWTVRRSSPVLVLGAVAYATTIEVLQRSLDTGRSPDIDDVLLNVVGFAGALAVGSTIRRVRPMRRSRIGGRPSG